MSDNHKKFLEFNGRSISFLSIDGTYWVAVKPICDALGVNYDRQYKNLKDDEIFGQLYAEQPMVAADGKLRQMVSLPEKWVYGWLLSIRSESAELKEYKLTCYNLLYDHFHGAITERLTVLREKTEEDLAIERMQNELQGTKLFQDIVNAKQRQKLRNKVLSKLDDTAIQQMDIFEKVVQ